MKCSSMYIIVYLSSFIENTLGWGGLSVLTVCVVLRALISSNMVRVQREEKNIEREGFLISLLYFERALHSTCCSAAIIANVGKATASSEEMNESRRVASVNTWGVLVMQQHTGRILPSWLN